MGGAAPRSNRELEGSGPEPQVVSLGRGLRGGPRFWGHSTSTSGSVTNTITWPGWGRESFGSQQGSAWRQGGMGLLKCARGLMPRGGRMGPLELTQEPYAKAERGGWALRGLGVGGSSWPSLQSRAGTLRLHTGPLACPAPWPISEERSGWVTKVPGRGQQSLGHTQHTERLAAAGRGAVPGSPIPKSQARSPQHTHTQAHRPHSLGPNLGWELRGPPQSPALGDGLALRVRPRGNPSLGIPGSTERAGDPGPLARLAREAESSPAKVTRAAGEGRKGWRATWAQQVQ